jgi:hypothetical protein
VDEPEVLLRKSINRPLLSSDARLSLRRRDKTERPYSQFDEDAKENEQDHPWMAELRSPRCDFPGVGYVVAPTENPRLSPTGTFTRFLRSCGSARVSSCMIRRE